jgi:hypothetical protein
VFSAKNEIVPQHLDGLLAYRPEPKACQTPNQIYLPK